MSVSIKDVAELAGVSTKTVSRVVNNESHVKQATFDKVMTAVKALDYQPSFAARHLAGSRSYSIAFIYDNPNAYYIMDMQEGILSSCKKHGYELIIQPCKEDNQNLIAEIATMIKRSSIAGLILTPPFSESPEFIKAMYQLGVKVVGIKSENLSSPSPCPSITINDRQAAFDLTQHLISIGHKHIGFISGCYEHESTSQRLLGYRQALTKNNENECIIFDGDYSFESGIDGVEHILSKDSRVTAIVACNDEIAAGAVHKAKLMGKSVPQDLSIAGFENSPFSRQTYPYLTSVDQSNNEISKNATNLLISLLRKQQDHTIITRYTPQLILRDSTTQAFMSLETY